MDTKYTDEKNTQIVLSLLKAHNIKKVIASPGTTNIRLVASMQQDSYFEMYSAADERSAAYIACGLAEESGEPVVLSCTGATASRNYIPGLTEAFYRKIPILAITSTQHTGRIGQNIAQVLDRSQQLKDMVKLSVQLQTCHTSEDEWACSVNANRALLELRRNGGGPVHINLETTYSSNFSVEELPVATPIHRYGYNNHLPNIEAKKIGVFVGAHSQWSSSLLCAIDEFCDKYGAVVLCDQTSNYRGKYRTLFSLVTSQRGYHANCNEFDLLIHIGNISGAYPSFTSKEEWRVNCDGEIRDTFSHLTKVFEMDEECFFRSYLEKTFKKSTSLAELWRNEYSNLYEKIPELPYSNIWIAKLLANKIPNNSVVHLGILNTLRSWNFFETPNTTRIYCNTGGFGIDGILSSAIGAALGNSSQIVYCIIGDLAFFYDMNSLGNRHLPSNMRILLVNNGCGTEFKNYNHPGAQFGEDANEYIAANGHYGRKSNLLVKHYAEDLGFEYLSAHNKNEFLQVYEKFIDDSLKDKPMLFEVFTESSAESEALKQINSLMYTGEVAAKENLKKAVKGIVGDKGIQLLKKVIKS